MTAQVSSGILRDMAISIRIIDPDIQSEPPAFVEEDQSTQLTLEGATLYFRKKKYRIVQASEVYHGDFIVRVEPAN
jgi:hypothetical protein